MQAFFACLSPSRGSWGALYFSPNFILIGKIKTKRSAQRAGVRIVLKIPCVFYSENLDRRMPARVPSWGVITILTASVDIKLRADFTVLSWSFSVP